MERTPARPKPNAKGIFQSFCQPFRPLGLQGSFLLSCQGKIFIAFCLVGARRNHHRARVCRSSREARVASAAGEPTGKDVFGRQES